MALTGGCQCGAVRYELRGNPKVILCHCRMCQRAVGGPFAAFACGGPGEFSWTGALPATFRSSSIAERDFCPRCGTPLTFRYIGKDSVDVLLGTLDAPEALQPVRQTGVESQAKWLAEPLRHIPAQRTEDNDYPGDMSLIVSYQRGGE